MEAPIKLADLRAQAEEMGVVNGLVFRYLTAKNPAEQLDALNGLCASAKKALDAKKLYLPPELRTISSYTADTEGDQCVEQDRRLGRIANSDHRSLRQLATWEFIQVQVLEFLKPLRSKSLDELTALALAGELGKGLGNRVQSRAISEVREREAQKRTAIYIHPENDCDYSNRVSFKPTRCELCGIEYKGKAKLISLEEPIGHDEDGEEILLGDTL